MCALVFVQGQDEKRKGSNAWGREKHTIALWICKRRNKDPFSACQRFWSLLSLWYRNAVNVREKQGDEGPVQSRSPRKEKRNG